MILAGDIGGTKTVLSLLTRSTEGLLHCLKEKTYSSQHHAEFDSLLLDFLPIGESIHSVCFGVAGPVVNQRCQTTNLPWLLDAEALKVQLNTDKVRLLNDLEAMALGMLYLPEEDLIELNPKAKPQTGTIAVLAAGTGHTDFAPQNALQDQLLVYLRQKIGGHVSYERIVSGVGFSHLYDFLCDEGLAVPCVAVTQLSPDEDRNALISKLGVAGADPCCVEVLKMFVDIYGAEAGNLALKCLSTGGVFIGGGIGPKILPALLEGRFMQAFKDKGRFLPMLESLSVKLSLNPRTPLIGAINYFNN